MIRLFDNYRDFAKACIFGICEIKDNMHQINWVNLKPREVQIRQNKKSLHGPGFEPGTPAVLRQCHNQLDHERLVTVYVH